MIEIFNSRRRILVTTIFNFHVITGNLIFNKIRRVKIRPSSTVNQGALGQRSTSNFAARCRPPAGRTAVGHPQHLTKVCRKRTPDIQGTLCKDVCVFYAILISKSVSRAIFDTKLVYFIGKLVILTQLFSTDKNYFCELFALKMCCTDRAQYCF